MFYREPPYAFTLSCNSVRKWELWVGPLLLRTKLEFYWWDEYWLLHIGAFCLFVLLCFNDWSWSEFQGNSYMKFYCLTPLCRIPETCLDISPHFLLVNSWLLVSRTCLFSVGSVSQLCPQSTLLLEPHMDLQNIDRTGQMVKCPLFFNRTDFYLCDFVTSYINKTLLTPSVLVFPNLYISLSSDLYWLTGEFTTIFYTEI